MGRNTISSWDNVKKKGNLAPALLFYCSQSTKEDNTTSRGLPSSPLRTVALKTTVYVIASEN